MTDESLTIIAAIGLSLALLAGMAAHTRADDAKRLDLAGCRADLAGCRADLAGCRADLATESEVADLCMGVVEQCRALVGGHACACWRAP